MRDTGNYADATAFHGFGFVSASGLMDVVSIFLVWGVGGERGGFDVLMDGLVVFWIHCIKGIWFELVIDDVFYSSSSSSSFSSHQPPQSLPFATPQDDNKKQRTSSKISIPA